MPTGAAEGRGRCWSPVRQWCVPPRKGVLAGGPSWGRLGLRVPPWGFTRDLRARRWPLAGRATNSPKPGSINSQRAWGEWGFSINSPVLAQQLGPSLSHGLA